MKINDSLVRCVVKIERVHNNFVEVGEPFQYVIGEKHVVETSQSAVNSFVIVNNAATVFTNDGTLYTNDEKCYQKHNGRLQKNMQRLLAAKLVDTEKKIENIGKFKEFVILDRKNNPVSKIRRNPDYTGKRALNPAFIGSRRAVAVGENGMALIDGIINVHTANDWYVVETEDALICEFDFSEYIEEARTKKNEIVKMFSEDVRNTKKKYVFITDVQKIEKVPQLSVDNLDNISGNINYVCQAGKSLSNFKQRTSVDCIDVHDSVLITSKYEEYPVLNVLTVSYSVYGPFVLETEDACYGNFVLSNAKVKVKAKVK